MSEATSGARSKLRRENGTFVLVLLASRLSCLLEERTSIWFGTDFSVATYHRRNLK
jgi:hypothetical protein